MYADSSIAKAIRGTTETPDADLQYFPSKRAEEQDADLQYFPSKRAEEQDADLQYFPSKRAEEQDADLQYFPSKRAEEQDADLVSKPFSYPPQGAAHSAVADSRAVFLEPFRTHTDVACCSNTIPASEAGQNQSS